MVLLLVSYDAVGGRGVVSSVVGQCVRLGRVANGTVVAALVGWFAFLEDSIRMEA